MSQSIKTILKRDVLAVKEGARLGSPKDILIDPRKQRVAALVLANQKTPHISTAISGSAVRSFSEDTLAIADVSAVQLGYQSPELLELLTEDTHFRGRDIFSTTGQNLGRVVDLSVDEKGQVTGYRVARGLLRRLLRMTETIEPSAIRTAGEDTAVAKDAPEARGA